MSENEDEEIVDVDIQPNQSLEDKVGVIKKGDYMIHVLIQEARNLQLDNVDTVDPIVEVSCFGKKYYTKCKDDISVNTAVTWNEHMFFEPKDLNESDIQNERLKIKMLDQRMLKNATIGGYEMDLSYIYFKEKHTIFSQWIGLSDPSVKKFNEISGYLRISVSVIGPGDEQVPLDDNAGIDRTDREVMLLPPHISMHYYQFKFRLIKAEHLPKMDTFGTIDAYVKVQYMGKSIKTRVVTQKNDQVMWAQEIWLPVQAPLVSSRLVMQVMDDDKGSSDEICGSISFKLHEVIKQAKRSKSFPWFWKDIYGAAPGVSGKNTDEMNNVPEVASHWKGRILMQVCCEKTDKPQMKLKNVTDDVLQEAAPFLEKQSYEIKASIAQGVCLPQNKLKVKIQIGEFSIMSKSPKMKSNGFCFWNQRFGDEVWECPYKSLDTMADVIIYLMSGDDPICYYRCRPEEFANPNAEMKWVPMINDKSVDQVGESHKAGLISFRLSIHDQTNGGDVDWDYVPAWSMDLPEDPYKYPIRCNIYQCKELPPSDDNGTSDPYVQVWSPFDPDTEKELSVKTKFVNDNNNPIFYETIQSYFYATEVDWAPPVILEIYDRDSGSFDSDDFIGRAVIPLEQASVSYDEEVKRPKWHPVKLGFREDEPEMGQILVSFNVLDPDKAFRKSLSSIRLCPECDEYQITINVLGLRELQSPGILPIRKAFIKFMLRSLLPPKKAHAIENIETQPSATGPNPTISTVIQFSILLPNDALYCPSLTCGVYDYIFKGMSQPLVGNFVINIGELQHLQDDLFKEEDQKTSDIIRALDKKIKEAEHEKKRLEEERVQAEKERLQEEKMKKQLVEKAVLKLRQRKSEGLREEQKMSPVDQESIDIEMGKLGDNSPEMASLPDEEEEKFERVHEEEETELLHKESAMDLVKIKEKEDGVNKRTEKEKVEQIMNEKEEKKHVIKMKRQNMAKKLFKQMKLVGKNVVYPTYAFDDRLKIYREELSPPKEMFLPIGYDPKHDSKQKHYRRFYEDELENIPEVMPRCPFQKYNIIRGQSRGLSKSWLWKDQTDEAGQVSTIKEVGQFKGIVNVINKSREESFNQIKEVRIQILKESLNNLSLALMEAPFDYDYEKLSTAEGRELFNAKMQQMGCENLQITKHFTQMNYSEELIRLMMLRTKCIIRVYILDVDELPPKDIGGSCDPYIKLKLNGKTFDERDNYTENSHSAEIYKMFEFDSEFPGCGHLKMQMWDRDALFGDDFIGETVVDLEDRFFSPDWQSIKNKPIEYRQLYHKSTKVSQGIIKCWIDILPFESLPPDNKPWSIAPRPVSEFEVRLVVWDTKNVVMKDWEGTSDIYVRAFFDSNNKNKRTDTHYRCMDGKGSFNYRLKFDVKNQGESKVLNLQVYDADLFSGNDFIGDSSLNLALAFEDATMTNRSIAINKKYYDSFLKDYMGDGELVFEDDSSFWLEMRDKHGESNGQIRVTIDILPKEQAENYQNAEGRHEPNHSPFLPPPTGRIVWSLNPWTMLNQCVAPHVRNKILCGICCVLCIVLFILMIVFFFPTIVAEIITAAIFG